MKTRNRIKTAVILTTAATTIVILATKRQKAKFLYSGSHSALRRPHSIQCIALERINTQNSEYTKNS